MVFADPGVCMYVRWFEHYGFSKQAPNGGSFSNRKIADIVEAALTLHLITVFGGDVSSLGDTEIFANWIVRDILS